MGRLAKFSFPNKVCYDNKIDNVLLQKSSVISGRLEKKAIVTHILSYRCCRESLKIITPENNSFLNIFKMKSCLCPPPEDLA